jgi:hypothetical protein
VPVLCLVPSPLRASRAVRRLCDAEDGLLFGARVETVDAAAARVLAAAADPRPILSPLAERLLAAEAGAAAGGELAGLAPDGGLASALASALAELRRGEVEAADIRAAARELSGRAAARLASLGEALAAYEARLADLGALDRAAALRAAAEALPRAAANEELRALDLLVVDGFCDLPPAAFDLVAALARCARRTHARLPFFPDRADLCAPAEPLLRRLEGMHELAAARDVTVALGALEPGRDRAPGIAGMLRRMWGGAAGEPQGAAPDARGAAASGCVRAACGAGEAGEAEAAARAVARLLDEGCPAGDVVVLAPAPARAAAPLESALAALGIPFASGRGEALDEAPVAGAVLAAIEGAPSRSRLEALASSPWFPARAAPRLEHWLDRAGAMEGRGDPEDALRRRAAALSGPAGARERRALQGAADAVAALRALVAPLCATGTARDHASRLRAFAAAAGMRRRAVRAEPAVATAAIAALARLEDVADELARAFALVGSAGERLAPGRWAALLRVAASAAGVPRPEPAAGAVELWGLSEAPGLDARAAVVTGCARGAFPAAPGAEPLLRDAERAAVNRALRRAAVASGPMRRASALHAAFCALAAGREAVVLTWASPGADGTGAPPAPLAIEALAAAGVEAPAAPGADPPLAASRSAREALRAAARAGAAGRGPAAVAALGGASSALAARAASAIARGAVEAERWRAIAARAPARAAGGIPPPALPLLTRALPEEWSPSQLEAHARCPYRAFASIVLAVPDREGADLEIDPRDEGRLAHAVLERFLRERGARGALPLRGAPEEREHLREVASGLFARFAADGRVGDPAVWAARREAVLARLERVAAAEAEEGAGLVPALLEYAFGGSSGAPPLVFGEGAEEVRLRGRLDRVDAGPDRLLLLDYKDSRAAAEHRAKLEPEALGVTNFQVPAYLMAAARELPGRARLGATYLLLRSAERLQPIEVAPGDPLFALAPQARAAARDAGARPFADAVLGAVRRIRAGELPIAPRDCAGCSFGALCRAQGVAEEAA